MPESFLIELQAQLRGAREDLKTAVRVGDDFLADALSARLDQLRRLAVDHEVRC